MDLARIAWLVGVGAALGVLLALLDASVVAGPQTGSWITGFGVLGALGAVLGAATAGATRFDLPNGVRWVSGLALGGVALGLLWTLELPEEEVRLTQPSPAHLPHAFWLVVDHADLDEQLAAFAEGKAGMWLPDVVAAAPTVDADLMAVSAARMPPGRSGPAGPSPHLAEVATWLGYEAVSLSPGREVSEGFPIVAGASPGWWADAAENFWLLPEWGASDARRAGVDEQVAALAAVSGARPGQALFTFADVELSAQDTLSEVLAAFEAAVSDAGERPVVWWIQGRVHPGPQGQHYPAAIVRDAAGVLTTLPTGASGFDLAPTAVAVMAPSAPGRTWWDGADLALYAEVDLASLEPLDGDDTSDCGRPPRRDVQRPRLTLGEGVSTLRHEGYALVLRDGQGPRRALYDEANDPGFEHDLIAGGEQTCGQETARIRADRYARWIDAELDRSRAGATRSLPGWVAFPAQREDLPDPLAP